MWLFKRGDPHAASSGAHTLHRRRRRLCTRAAAAATGGRRGAQAAASKTLFRARARAHIREKWQAIVFYLLLLFTKINIARRDQAWLPALCASSPSRQRRTRRRGTTAPTATGGRTRAAASRGSSASSPFFIFFDAEGGCYTRCKHAIGVTPTTQSHSSSPPPRARRRCWQDAIRAHSGGIGRSARTPAETLPRLAP